MPAANCCICSRDRNEVFVFCRACGDLMQKAAVLVKQEIEDENEHVIEELKLLKEIETAIPSEFSDTCSPNQQPQDEEEVKVANLEEKFNMLKIEKCELEAQLKEMTEIEESLLADLAEWQCKSIETFDLYGQVSAFHSNAEARLHKLQKVNALNDAFHIWQVGPVGTINGFRLGRCPPTQNVSWEEINIALGLVCQLLDVIVRNQKLTLEAGTLIPKGASSSILKKDVLLELHESRNSFSRIFSGKKLDTGLVALLECVKEVIASCRIDGKPPFTMEGECIEGQSIRLLVSGEVEWSKAMRLLLFNLKWLIAVTRPVGKSRPTARKSAPE